MEEYAFHPLADWFPMMEGEEFADLVADIKANGLECPIVLYEGKILDGRNRYRACGQAGVEPKYQTPQIEDPVQHILTHNLHRRHLTISQRAMLADKKREYYERRAKERQRAGQEKGRLRAEKRLVHNYAPTKKTLAQEEAAAAVGVSRFVVDQARKVREGGAEEVIHAVEKGELTVNAAAQVLGLPKDEQMAAVHARKQGRSRRPPMEKAKAVRLTSKRRSEILNQCEKIMEHLNVPRNGMAPVGLIRHEVGRLVEMLKVLTPVD